MIVTLTQITQAYKERMSQRLIKGEKPLTVSTFISQNYPKTYRKRGIRLEIEKSLRGQGWVGLPSKSSKIGYYPFDPSKDLFKREVFVAARKGDGALEQGGAPERSQI